MTKKKLKKICIRQMITIAVQNVRKMIMAQGCKVNGYRAVTVEVVVLCFVEKASALENDTLGFSKALVSVYESTLRHSGTELRTSKRITPPPTDASNSVRNLNAFDASNCVRNLNAFQRPVTCINC